MSLMALGDTARFINGAAFKPSDWEDEGLPIIRIQNLTGTGEKFNLTTRKVKTELIVEPGDLLVSWSATLDVYRWSGPRGVLNQHIFKVLPNPGIDPEYLFYALKNSLAELSAKTHGSTMKHVVRGDFESTQVNVPPLPEQRRIVDLLSRAEGIVRLRREAEKKAAELIPALFIDLFGDPATNPKGWAMALLPDVLSRPFKNGLYLPKDKYSLDGSDLGVEMVHMSDAFYGEVKRGDLRRVLADEKQIRDYGLTKTDLLVARRSLNFDGAAKLCGVPESREPLLFESSFIRVTPKQDVVRTEFLLSYLNNESTRKAHVLSRISGITISGINQAALNQIPVLLPPVELQERFVTKVGEVQSIQSQQSAATSKAQAALDALLARCFARSADDHRQAIAGAQNNCSVAGLVT
jgi:type I restriction enzyme S subunit